MIAVFGVGCCLVAAGATVVWACGAVIVAMLDDGDEA